ncbi:glucose-6-phosphate dehydrogenase [Planctomycetota bacterium]
MTEEIKASVVSQDIICAELQAPPSLLAVFGASGDLANRKLIPSLFQLFKRGLLSEKFCLLGASRTNFTDEQFRQRIQKAIKNSGVNVTGGEVDAFLKKVSYINGDYGDISFYNKIQEKLNEQHARYKTNFCHIFYLAVPPVLYSTIVDFLGRAGLSCTPKTESKPQPRIVVEKPFGSDLESAEELNEKIHKCFDESQIYRIDHYLGKETVQNILMFRFANAIFEPLWNRNYIDHVQITIAESIGIEHRGSYYDKAGALRDMFQNHMLQMLALAAMEPPTSFDADSIRDEKVKLLRSIRPFSPQRRQEYIIRGQYGPGAFGGKEVAGYQDEPGIEPDSRTETFVAAKLFMDNWRWKDVPFYLRAGKKLAYKDTEFAITFKKVPHSMFASSGLSDMPANVLVLQIQPEEGISLNFQAKRPGSKICMSTLNMNFSYKNAFGISMPEAYQRLLLDCMVGDQTLFTRADDVETTWRLLTPILQAWEEDESVPYEYPAGAESFAEADRLIESDGRKWRKLSAI